jgi:trimethylamine--corrinoid protein Co-methyltransferase
VKAFANPLGSEEVVRIHEASLEILEQVGLLVHSDKARNCLLRHGCSVDSQTLRVRFPRKTVEDFRKAFPPSFTFHGRDSRYDRVIPKDGPLIVTGSSAPDIIDPETGEERRARSNIAHRPSLTVAGYDIFRFRPGRRCSCRSVKPRSLLSSTEKLSETGAEILPIWKNLAKSFAWVSSSPEVRRDTGAAFYPHHFCNVVSPLTMDVVTEMMMLLVEKGFPCFGSIVPNAGLTAPLSLAGTLAQGNAEFLALAVLTQMVRSETPLIYCALPTVADMRTGAYAPGGIETGTLMAGFSQMARYYGVPSGGYIGLTNSKVNDAQAGYETGMSAVAAVMAGADMLNMGGLLDALMTFDYAKAVIDDEIALMLKRVKQGFDVDEENLSLQVIAEVGPGGMFMEHPHTLGRMRKTALLPAIADRNSRQQWKERGGLDAHARALTRARDILAHNNPAVFSAEVDERIRTEFKNLVHKYPPLFGFGRSEKVNLVESKKSANWNAKGDTEM